MHSVSLCFPAFYFPAVHAGLPPRGLSVAGRNSEN